MKYLVVAALLLLASSAWAGTVTFDFGGTPATLTTNAKQDEKIQRLLNEYNQGRTPPLTMEQYNRDVVYVEKLKELNNNAIVIETQDFCTAYQTWTQPQKDQVYTLGGNNSPCP